MPKMKGIFLGGEHDASTQPLDVEALDRGSEGPFDDVVTEHDQHGFLGDEALSKPQGLGDAPRAFLVRVGEPPDPMLVSVAQETQEFPGVSTSSDHHDVGDAGQHKCLDRVADHRPVVYG